MKVDKKEYKNINETLYRYEHKSGLLAYVIQKKGYSKKHASFSTNYGSINNKFIVPGESEVTSVPDGIAHFLEHKLFEQKDGSIMGKFAELGASPNAYTGFNQTVYHFTCTDRFDENFRLLTNFVQNPYLTEESVEKEKGIIEQEIMMYQDDPGWRAYFNLLNAIYKNNPVRIDIAGTVESIRKINKDILYKCYNTFYNPSNMMILAVGDVDPKSVFEMIDESIKDVKAVSEIKRIFPEEPGQIKQNYIEQALQVSMPQFQMGFKDGSFSGNGYDCLTREVAVKILLEMIMGRSSALFNDLYNQGIINASFDYSYTIENNYAFSLFGGESSDPGKVKEGLNDTLDGIRKNGLDKKTYERIKKSMYGRFIRQFNFIEKISHTFISVYFKGVNIFDYLGIYDRITFEYLNEVLESHFNMDNLALSVIKPV